MSEPVMYLAKPPKVELVRTACLRWNGFEAEQWWGRTAHEVPTQAEWEAVQHDQWRQLPTVGLPVAA